MTVVANQVRVLLRDLLERRAGTVWLAMAQRSKFEGWLKLELAAVLSGQIRIADVRLEDQYPGGGRADLSFSYDGVKWFVEMKTANTNWRHAAIESKTRPIKMNIDDIIEDIKKARRGRVPSNAIVLFVIFPIPRRIWTREREKLLYHLRRIEREATLAHGSVEKSGEFVELQEGVGLAIYVLDIV